MKALVTGASSGIGRALALRLAARGMEVWLAARSRDALEALRAEIGERARVFPLDVARLDETVAALTRLDEETGGLDLVVANAGIGGSPRYVSEDSWERARDILHTNLLGAVATLMPFIPRMAARGRGHLAGISSIAADIPLPRSVPYGASKAGLTFFLECADLELRPKGVAVTIVHPGFIKTAMTAGIKERLPLLMDVDRAADIIDRGLARRARMVRFPWLTGAAARAVRSLPRALAAPLIRRAARGDGPA
ncbi:MAG TPA: SDR family NAD(P)-dependent oxidoreductase [Haliangiales bacterium]|nr:SDR family NAD(P)-dependent oxidoreductase [Haliangiales bacterium]